jgi:hypothetical protein
VPGEIRFHLDECVPGAVAEGLRRQHIDVTTTPELAFLGAPDVDQLAFATREERVLVTQDADFLALARQGRTHSGIAYYVPESRTLGEIIARLALIHAVLSTGEMAGAVEFL